MDNNDPAKTPILTPSMYCVFSTKAKFPTNKLIVKPIPVNIPTPYKFSQFEFLGISAKPNFIEAYENTNTPNCLPKNNPNKIPNGTGANRDDRDKPSRDTPALAKANKGIIK